MRKILRIPPQFVTDYASSGDVINSSHLHTIFDQDFREEMLRVFEKLKEMMETEKPYDSRYESRNDKTSSRNNRYEKYCM